MLIKLVDGTEQEIKLSFISGPKRNEILDNSGEFIQEGNKLKATLKPGALMNAVAEAVVPKGFNIETLSIESIDEIFDKYAHLFNQGTKEAKKKEGDLKEKSAGHLLSEEATTP